MSCPDRSESLSALLDGELSEPQAAELEDHLRGCPECRRQREELQGTMHLLRGLERHPAPAFSTARARAAAVAEAREARAERWAHIRSHSTATPRSGARSIAYAALVFVLALVLYRSVGTVDRPIPESPAAPGSSPADPRAALEAEEDERPEWLRREIARRVLDAREADAQAGTPSGSPADPTAATGGTAVAEMEPAAEDGRPADSPPPMRPALPEPGNRLAAAEPPAFDEDPYPVPEAVSGQQDTGPILADHRRVPASRPVGTQVVVGIPAAPEPSAQEPAAAQPTTLNLERPTPARAAAVQPEAPAAAEIEISHRTLASLVEREDGAEIVFHDADLAGGDPTARSGPATAAEMEGTPTERSPLPEREPEPDPLTGITPPLPIDQPGPDLGDRRLDRRAWGELAPLAARLVITEKGAVGHAEMVTRTGLDWLDEAMADALRAWTFRPAERDGQPIPVRIEIVVEFELD